MLPKLYYKIACIDFDGTIVSNEFPLVGLPNSQLIEKIREFKAAGGKWILWTCRNADDLKAAVQFCDEQDITPDSVNEDIPDIRNSEFGRSKSIKPYCDIYIDDKNQLIDEFVNTDFSSGRSAFEPGELQQSRMSGIIGFIGK